MGSARSSFRNWPKTTSRFALCSSDASSEQKHSRTRRPCYDFGKLFRTSSLAAEKDRKLRFTNLMHHLTLELLTSSFFDLKKNAAAGIDEVTWREYAQDYEVYLQDLHERVRSGRYQALASRRKWIPKNDGKLRPLGIAALEDKIVQAAVVALLSPIYEVDFVGFSDGFRPGRSQHNALDALSVGRTQRNVNWVLDADIKGFSLRRRAAVVAERECASER